MLFAQSLSCARRLGLRYKSTKIEKIILDNIKATGPISFASYMQMCLSHPTHGYYMNPVNNVIGSAGDFTTSPEISQVFGELVSIWLISQWMHAGSPPIRLVELGPGRGTLMDDILHVLKSFPQKPIISQVHLVETSKAMRVQQNDALAKHNVPMTWHDSINEISTDSKNYTMLVAHEFFDALPFHTLQKTAQGFQEILIASKPTLTPVHNSQRQPQLQEVLSSSPTPGTFLGLSSSRFATLPPGTRIEVSPASWKIARSVSQLISSGSGGAGLIIDYGDDHLFGNSFRAFKNHKLVDAFHRPGECDLTVNVDFAYLKEAMNDIAMIHGPLTQREFLLGMGLNVRVESLAERNPTRRQAIEEAAERLISATGMGAQYRVLGLTQQKTEQQAFPFNVTKFE